jgi:hypothetical protein
MKIAEGIEVQAEALSTCEGEDRAFD